MKIVFTEAEKPVIDRLAKISGFPINKFISGDGFTIYLKQSVVINKLEGYIQDVRNLPDVAKRKLVNKVLEKLSEELPGGFIRKP